MLATAAVMSIPNLENVKNLDSRLVGTLYSHGAENGGNNIVPSFSNEARNGVVFAKSTKTCRYIPTQQYLWSCLQEVSNQQWKALIEYMWFTNNWNYADSVGNNVRTWLLAEVVGLLPCKDCFVDCTCGYISHYFRSLVALYRGYREIASKRQWY